MMLGYAIRSSNACSRNRRAGIVTRIAEGMTEWNWDGRIGYGLSEYLDHFDE